MPGSEKEKADENPGQSEKEMKNESGEAPKKEQKASSREDKLREQLAEANAEAAKWKNSYYMAYADLDNLRKGLEKDHRDAIKYRAEGFLANLFPALDSFYIALQATPSSPEAKNYQVGFTFIYNQITSVLAEEGVSQILPKEGDKFDPSDMHAVDTVEAEAEGLVAKVVAKGYRLKDRMVRPAMVIVTKRKADEKKEPSGDKPLSDNKEVNKA